MAANTLNILKPSVNNMTARVFVRAAGLDCDEIDVWVTRDRFHAVVEEGTGFGWPRAMHRSPSHSHRSFMLRTLRNFTRRVSGERGELRVTSNLGPTRDLLDEIETAIDGWVDERGLGKNEARP